MHRCSLIILLLTLLGGFALTSADKATARQNDGAGLQASFRTSLAGSTSELPFWLYANRYGELEAGSAAAGLSLLSASYRLGGPQQRYLLETGAGIALRAADTRNSAHFQTLYLRAEYGIFRLEAGRFYDDAEMTLPHLTSGSMIVSRNATPVPRIQLSTRDFINIPFTAGHVQFRGRYSDGQLESSRYVSNALLHQKMAHLKFNIWRFEIMTGFIHNVVWAGTDPERGKLPRSFSDYMRVVTGRSADPESSASVSEQINRLGNGVAAYDGSMIVHLNGAQLVAYRQIYLEDTVSLRLRSYMDGLYGLGFQHIQWFTWLNTLILEYVNTIRQDSLPGMPPGRARYYNHGNYYSGWTYQGNVLGNPLLTIDPERERYPVFNNMIIGWHLGMDGQLSDQLSWQFLGTFTRNYGNCNDDLLISGNLCSVTTTGRNPRPGSEARPRSEVRRDQYSFAFSGSYTFEQMPALSTQATLAIDTGAFLGNRLGLEISLLYRL
ncbi:MAG: capsule assembly Wzi family protein [Candidatus Cyclonatronum sp.]|uniref:capsule assembly Wzi family protein n=1 Tax=Cyclonatronum sp. TaxID=3024185 RepID=UPI0025C2F7CF|nr:capsule assembly Wzi family protein [Cyclonatronum sp.]MCH8486067.1 capsule assembly Wzi family protein [Cyclonatronum sp.]